MTYNQALEYIHSVCWMGSRPGLSRITELCEKLSLLSDREQSELITAFCKITDILK